jgi:hypothetical protein
VLLFSVCTDTDRQMDRQTDRWTDRQTDDRQTDRWTDNGQTTDRQTDRHKPCIGEMVHTAVCTDLVKCVFEVYLVNKDAIALVFLNI